MEMLCETDLVLFFEDLLGLLTAYSRAFFLSSSVCVCSSMSSNRDLAILEGRFRRTLIFLSGLSASSC